MTKFKIQCKIRHGDNMKNINHDKVERFFDFIDSSLTAIYEKTKQNYFTCLFYVFDFLIYDTDSLNRLDEELINTLDNYYKDIKDESFNQEEIRKAVQLSLLKGLKHENMHLSETTPDSLGILFAYIIDILYAKERDLSIFDPNVGFGNLLFSLLNSSNKNFSKIYGVDQNQVYLEFARRVADLLEYEIEFFNQNNLRDMLIPPVDVVISDLPMGEEELTFNTELITHAQDVKYKPYLMIENFMKYVKEGGYFFYLIPNDFFIMPNNELIKGIILNETNIQGIIELPDDLFNDEKAKKSILILQKKGKTVPVNKEILMMRFPSFKDKEKVQNAVNQIKLWYKNRY